MKKELLLNMLDLSYKNQNSKYISELILQIAVDPELIDVVTIDSFSNEFYSVRSIKWIKKCFDFKLI
jgi:hypothetical protein